MTAEFINILEVPELEIGHSKKALSRKLTPGIFSDDSCR
jgi:hypothetical protein